MEDLAAVNQRAPRWEYKPLPAPYVLRHTQRSSWTTMAPGKLPESPGDPFALASVSDWASAAAFEGVSNCRCCKSGVCRELGSPAGQQPYLAYCPL
jgi:hypothetical protein